MGLRVKWVCLLAINLPEVNIVARYIQQILFYEKQWKASVLEGLFI